MQYAAVQRIIGLLLIIFSSTHLPPAVVGLIYGGEAVSPFLGAFGLTLLAGLLLWLPVHRSRSDLRTRDGFLVVALFWIVLSLFAALPFLLWNEPQFTVANAVFEATSGLTTTGSTVLSGLDRMPHSILFYRQQLQWLGGMGIIVLAVAILPMLGIGGM